jgi:hypothetical protein
MNIGSTLKIKSFVFCHITPCSLLKVNRNFGGTSRLYLQGRRISHTRWKRHIPLKRWLNFYGLHCVIPQKIELS